MLSFLPLLPLLPFATLFYSSVLIPKSSSTSLFPLLLSFPQILLSLLPSTSLYRMVELAIEDRVIPKNLYNEKAVKYYIEKQLLPSINNQDSDKAHNMYYAVQAIYEVFIVVFMCYSYGIYIVFIHKG